MRWRTTYASPNGHIMSLAQLGQRTVWSRVWGCLRWMFCPLLRFLEFSGRSRSSATGGSGGRRYLDIGKQGIVVRGILLFNWYVAYFTTLFLPLSGHLVRRILFCDRRSAATRQFPTPQRFSVSEDYEKRYAQTSTCQFSRIDTTRLIWINVQLF